MHLINVHTCELEEFIANPPPYAILSHRWREGEVSFQDFQDKHRRSEKNGYKKIRTLCHQARRDGLNWAWIDTCCIDKSSSAELSEAINSMFKWYKNSDVCYAYLDDITSLNGDGGLITSEWFKRGWTLQELIAPRNLQFYCNSDSGWQYLGDKNGLAETLSQRTRIDIEILRGFTGLDNYTVAKRMSWAAGRKTTREEDIGYCLMGLFSINMPLLYGEGSKAFLRLQEEVVTKINDQTIFAWQPPELELVTYSGMFALTPDSFALSGELVSLQNITIANHIDITANGFRTKTTACPTGGQIEIIENRNQSCLLLPLSCCLPRSVLNNVFAAILLVWDGGNKYRRRHGSQLFEVKEEDIRRDTTIFIRKFYDGDVVLSLRPGLPSPDRWPCKVFIQLPDTGITLLRASEVHGRYDHSHSVLLISVDPYQIMSTGNAFKYGLVFDIGDGAFIMVAIELFLEKVPDRCTYTKSAETRHRMTVHTLSNEGNVESIRNECRQKLSSPSSREANSRLSIQNVTIARPDRYNADQLYLSLQELECKQGEMFYFLRLSFKGSKSWVQGEALAVFILDVRYQAIGGGYNMASAILYNGELSDALDLPIDPDQPERAKRTLYPDPLKGLTNNKGMTFAGHTFWCSTRKRL
ncbi:HET-domain-containing protein [Xylariaceae sp. AK1471]|nr:HET-domain-containing protein [Xylariaceae sp. AK1471]